MPTMRLDITKSFREGNVKIGEENKGQRSAVKPVKNDFNNDFEPYTIEIKFGHGVVLNPDDIAFGIQQKILEKSGANGASFMKGKLKWSSRRELYQHYDDNNPLLKILHAQLTKAAHAYVAEQREAEGRKYNKEISKVSTKTSKSKAVEPEEDDDDW